MSASNELISVVMPVHNALPHLDAAVRSILDQSYSDFEFVILDDASTDGSAERLREWRTRDRRIRLLESERNLGPVGSSSLVVEQACAPLIARMDADDTCTPDRLQRQLDVLQERPEVGLVASVYEIIDERGRLLRGPETWRLTRNTPFVPFAHGSIMFRRSVFDQVGGYREPCAYWEDQDLVVRMAAVSEVLTIPSAFYQVRQWMKSTRGASNPERFENAVDLMYRAIARLEQGKSYDDLLQERTTPARVDPRVFISRGSVVLWAGCRPRLVGRLLKRGRLQFDMQTFSTFIWTVWAALSPSSLRAFLKALLRIRNRRAATLIPGPSPIRWSPGFFALSARRLGHQDVVFAGRYVRNE